MERMHISLGKALTGALLLPLMLTACSPEAAAIAPAVQEEPVMTVVEPQASETIPVTEAPVCPTEPEPAPPAGTPEQAALFYKCMNTLEMLDQLSGEIVISKPARSDGLTKGSFALDLVNDCYHTVIHHEGSDDLMETECFNQAGNCITLYDYRNGRQSEYTNDPYGQTLEGIVWSDQANIYNTYGKDPTGTHELGVCYIPQEMSLGYLENFDNWEITDVTDRDGRPCCCIRGKAEEAYGARFDVSTFAIWIDQETGIWYQYEGYNEDGELTDYFYTENMQFGDRAEPVEAFSEEKVDGYTLLELP